MRFADRVDDGRMLATRLAARASHRGGRPAVELAGWKAIDGLATGASMETACRAVAARGAGRIVVAVPVAAVEAYVRLRVVADEVVAVPTPSPFRAAATLSTW
jgi:putative phosphoribosyl transferase